MSKAFDSVNRTVLINNLNKIRGAVAERLRYRSREKKVQSSSPRSDISVEVTSQC